MRNISHSNSKNLKITTVKIQFYSIILYCQGLKLCEKYKFLKISIICLIMILPLKGIPTT